MGDGRKGGSWDRSVLGSEQYRDTAMERKFLVGRRDDLETGRQARHVACGDMCPKSLMEGPRPHAEVQQGEE